nr:uncharacterized mitochondrial protein AtMg00810-like [Tanacetum cinerariifolium]
MGELTFFLGLQVKQKEDGIFISKDKYVAEILKKFRFSEVKTASTPMKTQKPLLKDEDEEEVDVHIYRSMIGSLMYLTFSGPDIMFAVCACARYQVNLKVSHIYAVNRIFRYFKCQPKLGLWYPKDSSFDLMAYTDSDYARASLDIKSTTKGYQFLWCRLISWQCKKQTVIANSTTEAEYVAASSCCGQVLWIQNQLLDYRQFWTTAKSKTVNEEVQIHTLVDGMKVIITESSVRRDLQLADEDDKQLDGLPTHKEKYDVSFHTKKVFANMKRIGKGFFGKETPLFPTMVGPNQVHMGEGSAKPTDTQHTPTFDMPPSKPKKTQKPRQPKRKTTKVPQPSVYKDIVADEAVHDELKRTKTAQQTKIDGLERRAKKLEKKHRSRTHKLKRLYKVGLTARVISFSDDKALDTEDTSKHRRIYEIDADEDNALVNTHDDVTHDDEGIKDVGEEEVVEVVTTAKMIVDAAQVTTCIADIPVCTAETIVTTALTITVESTKTNVKLTQDPKRKGTKALKNTSFVEIQELFDKTMKRINTFVDCRTELVKESTKKDEAETVQESSSKRTRDDFEQERSKKQKMEDDNESEELKQFLEIIPDDGDDVTIDATPLSVRLQFLKKKTAF